MKKIGPTTPGGLNDIARERLRVACDGLRMLARDPAQAGDGRSVAIAITHAETALLWLENARQGLTTPLTPRIPE